jgi:hypothetical protein
MEIAMPVLFDQLYRGFCRARLREMEKQVLGSHQPHVTGNADDQNAPQSPPVMEPPRDVGPGRQSRG